MRWLLVIAVLLGGCAADTRRVPDGRVSLCEYSADWEDLAFSSDWVCQTRLDCVCGSPCVEWVIPGEAVMFTSCTCDDRPGAASLETIDGAQLEQPEDCNPSEPAP